MVVLFILLPNNTHLQSTCISSSSQLEEDGVDASPVNFIHHPVPEHFMEGQECVVRFDHT